MSTRKVAAISAKSLADLKKAIDSWIREHDVTIHTISFAVSGNKHMALILYGTEIELPTAVETWLKEQFGS